MSFNPKFANSKFTYISIDKFLQTFKKNNPNENIIKTKQALLYFKELKLNGETCSCGNPIWIVGSAFSGKGCFTCITGESDCSNDYEIKIN